MADSNTSIIMVILVVALFVILFLELRYLRSRRKSREDRANLPDQAHNALTTTRAILRLVSNRGGDVSEARELLRESEMASSRGNYRVSIDLSRKAKSSLRFALRAVEAGAAASSPKAEVGESPLEERPRAEPVAEAPPSEEPRTTKEIIQEEFPEHYPQAKFSLTAARAKLKGADPSSEARALLDRAEMAFEREDYRAALSLAVRAQEARRDTPLTEPEAAACDCGQCGAPMEEGDEFCRKCGAKRVGATACPECGREVKAGDSFCRGCGAAYG